MNVEFAPSARIPTHFSRLYCGCSCHHRLVGRKGEEAGEWVVSIQEAVSLTEDGQLGACRTE